MSKALPARPVSGTYSNSSVNFTLKKGKVVGFSATTQTTCGGYPNFPTARIAGNGIVDAFDKGNQDGDAAFSVSLEMYVVGGRVVKGSFVYYGPGRCRAAADFKNLRVKR